MKYESRTKHATAAASVALRPNQLIHSGAAGSSRLQCPDRGEQFWHCRHIHHIDCNVSTIPRRNVVMCHGFRCARHRNVFDLSGSPHFYHPMRRFRETSSTLILLSPNPPCPKSATSKAFRPLLLLPPALPTSTTRRLSVLVRRDMGNERRD